MTKQTNKPAINGPVVTVDKKFGRTVLLGIVDSNRMVAHGFDADFPEMPGTTVHYRMVRHGKYNVLVGAQEPVEIRVMQDGKLLCEQRLDPLPQNVQAQGDSPVVRQVKEITNKPQPFFITNSNDGTPLMLTPDLSGRSAEERVAMQLHPGRLMPVRTSTMVVGEQPANIFMGKLDVNPVEALGLQPAPPPAKPDGMVDSAASASEPTADEQTPLNMGDADQTVVPASAEGDAPAAEPMTITVTPKFDEEAARAAALAHSQAELDGQAPLPREWAESDGLVIIGVRMIQQQVAGEPLMPPDGFTYVQFQLNGWDDHARIRANLHARIKLPPRIAYKDFVVGNEPDDGHDHSPTCGCGRNHGHDPRRFR